MKTGTGPFHKFHWFTITLSIILAGMGPDGHAQSRERVSFTITNPSLKTLQTDLRYIDRISASASGYGYGLGPLTSHAVNMPAGTRIYVLQNDAWRLSIVVDAGDNGKSFNMSKPYPLSDDQIRQALKDEQLEREKTQRENAIDAQLNNQSQGTEGGLVRVMIAGKTLWSRELTVRAEIPDNTGTTGFRKSLNWFSRFPVHFPAGTKLFLCDGEYWNKQVRETYLLTIEATGMPDLIRI